MIACAQIIMRLTGIARGGLQMAKHCRAQNRLFHHFQTISIIIAHIISIIALSTLISIENLILKNSFTF